MKSVFLCILILLFSKNVFANQLLECQYVGSENGTLDYYYHSTDFPKGNNRAEIIVEHILNLIHVNNQNPNEKFNPIAHMLGETNKIYLTLDKKNSQIFFNNENVSPMSITYTLGSIIGYKLNSRSRYEINRVSGRMTIIQEFPEWFIEEWYKKYNKKIPNYVLLQYTCKVVERQI